MESLDGGRMTQGFPTEKKDDLRYYLDTSGRFTSALRRDYAPLRRALDQRLVYVKCGSSWMDVSFDLLGKGMVFRLLDADGTFVKWADDGSIDMLAMGDPVRNREGVWGVQARKPTEMEFTNA